MTQLKNQRYNELLVIFNRNLPYYTLNVKCLADPFLTQSPREVGFIAKFLVEWFNIGRRASRSYVHISITLSSTSARNDA